MSLRSLEMKFRKNKIYKEENFGDSLSTLISYSNWCTDGDIAYEITEKKLTTLNYLLIKRVCGGDTKNLKFKGKNYLHSKLTTENKEQLASLSESSSNQKLLKWSIKLVGNNSSEKVNYQNINLETKNGKLFELSYLHVGSQESYIINYSNSDKSWEIVKKDVDQEGLKFELDSLQLKVCKFHFQMSQMKLPEPILLIVLSHLISYQSQILNYFTSPKLNISF